MKILEKIEKAYQDFKKNRPKEFIDGTVAVAIIGGVIVVNVVIVSLMVANLGCVFCIMFNLMATIWYVFTWRRS